MSEKKEAPKQTEKKSGAKDPVRFAEKVEQLQKELEAANAKVEKAEEKAQENWDKALRTLAEIENIRKRAEQDVEKAHKFAVEKFANGLLPVIDSLEKALEVSAETAEVQAMRSGIELTIKMFVDTVAKYGLVQINPVGEAFDPEVHEAMSMIEDPNYESNVVIQVYQTGYTLNGRLVRPARVVVNK